MGGVSMEFTTYTLGEVCSRLSSGKSIKASEVSEFGKYPVYGGNGLRGYSDKSNFNGSCAIIGRQGAYCGNVRYFEGEGYMTEHAVVCQANDKADNYYLSALLSTMHLERLSGQSAQPGLAVGTLSVQPIQLPSLSVQRRIAAILSSLDRKIELNNKINAQLEEMAQTLFKHWFVDFGPFKDGKFVESELGLIPEGWRVGTLDEIATITMGQSPSGTTLNEVGEGMIFYQGSSDFTFRYPNIRVYTKSPTRIAEGNSILFSVRAPVGAINRAKGICCIGRGVASIRSKHKCDSYLYYLMLSLRKLFDSYNGEGTVFGSINKKALEGISVIIPVEHLMSEINEKFNAIDNRIKALTEENQKLSVLRDTLLPKLMSGEIEL